MLSSWRRWGLLYVRRTFLSILPQHPHVDYEIKDVEENVEDGFGGKLGICHI